MHEMLIFLKRELIKDRQKDFLAQRLAAAELAVEQNCENYQLPIVS